MSLDDSNLLGLSSQGGFGSPKNTLSSFFGIEALTRTKKFMWRSSLHVGLTESDFNQLGLIEDIEDTYFSSFDLGVYKENIFKKNDSIGIQVYQPLRAEYSNLNFNIPIGRTKDKQILFDELSIDLTPSGRQINSQLIYAMTEDKLTFFGKLGVVSNEYHQSESRIEPYFQLDIEFRLE